MRKGFILAITLVMVLLIGIVALLQNQFAVRLFLWHANIQNSFVYQSFTSSRVGTALETESLIGKNNGNTIIITRSITNNNNNKNFVEDKRFLLTSLFEPTISSYPGVITNVISCPDAFKPIENKVSNGYIYLLGAGERFNYGICTNDLTVYQSAYGIFDCKDKGAFEVMYFTKDSRQKAKDVVQSFSC